MMMTLAAVDSSSSGNGGDDEGYDYAFGLVNKEFEKKK